MTKKAAAHTVASAIAAAHPSSSLPPLPPADPSLVCTEAEWTARFLTVGTAGAAAQKESRFTPLELEEAIALICAAPSTAAQLQIAREIAAYGIDGAFKSMLRGLAAKLLAARQPLPADLRKQEELTPADRATVVVIGERVRSARDILLDGARSTDQVDDLSLLGRGVPVGKTLDTIRDALQTFLAAVPERKAQLLDAGYTDAKVQILVEDQATIAAIALRASTRVSSKNASVQDILVFSLAIESAFHLYKARVKSALESSLLLKQAALKPVPRLPERRRTHDESGSGEGTGEGSGEGTGEGASADASEKEQPAKPAGAAKK